MIYRVEFADGSICHTGYRPLALVWVKRKGAKMTEIDEAAGTDNVVSIFPANDFAVVADNAKSEIEVGLILGYSPSGELTVFGGGMLDGRQPTCKDWLWMIETFKSKLIAGDYHD